MPYKWLPYNSELKTFWFHFAENYDEINEIQSVVIKVATKSIFLIICFFDNVLEITSYIALYILT